jgi:hypothetical protein
VTPAHLAELLRQRDLVRDHLAWLDREIASAAGVEDRTTATGAATPVAVEPRQADALVTEATSSLRAAEIFQPDPVNAAQSTRRGCFIAIVIAFLVTFLTFTAIYFVGYRDRGILSGSRAPEVAPQTARPQPRR